MRGGRWLQALRCAWRGVWLVLAGQRNGPVLMAAAAAAVALAIALRISGGEWCLVAGAIAAVLAAEAFNTAVEQLADAVCPEQHPGVGRAKDIAAGAVLLAAGAAAVIGAIVFLPKLLALTG